MGYPIVHFEIMGKDGEALQDFYSNVMGWKIDANNPMNYGMVDTDAGSAGIAGGVGPTEDGSSQVNIYIEVPDLEAVLDQVQAAGGKVVMPPMEIPDMVTFAQFSDPAGNVIGLVKSYS